MRTRSWSAWLVFSVFTASLLPGCPAHAHPSRAGYPYSIHIEDEWGSALRTFDHEGERFVLASRGQRYAIVLRNHTGRRVEAVVSVDGRDVVSGRVGDFIRERGYVLGPYATLRIDGFRKSHDEVAAFRFSSPEASYSARMGTPQNVGVVGAAFFPERVPPRPRPRPIVPMPESYRSEDKAKSGETPAASAAPQRSAAGESEARGRASADLYESAPSVNNLGTEYGETRESRVEEVRFVRASPDKPESISVLRYDNAAGLVARGIEIEPRRASYRGHVEPNPFPYNRFAPPPP